MRAGGTLLTCAKDLSRARKGTREKIERVVSLLGQQPTLTVPEACKKAGLSKGTFWGYFNWQKQPAAAAAAVPAPSEPQPEPEPDPQPQPEPEPEPEPVYDPEPPPVDEAIPEHYARGIRMLDAATDAGHALMIWGGAGQGKTSMVRNWAKNRNLAMCEWDMSGVGKENLSLPTVTEHSTIEQRLAFYESRGIRTTARGEDWLRNTGVTPLIEEALPARVSQKIYEAVAGGKEGVCLFLDEITTARVDGLNGIKKLITERQLGDVELPTAGGSVKLAIILAGNPPDIISGGVDEFDEAVRSRCCHMDIDTVGLSAAEDVRMHFEGWPVPEPWRRDPASWDHTSRTFEDHSEDYVTFAELRHVEGYTNSSPTYMEDRNPEIAKNIRALNKNDNPNRGFANNRTFRRLIHALSWADGFDDIDMKLMMCEGFIGKTRGREFLKHMTERPHVSPERVFRDFHHANTQRVPKYDKIEREDQAFRFYRGLNSRLENNERKKELKPEQLAAVCRAYSLFAKCTDVTRNDVAGPANEMIDWLDNQAKRFTRQSQKAHTSAARADVRMDPLTRIMTAKKTERMKTVQKHVLEFCQEFDRDRKQIQQYMEGDSTGI